MNQQRGDAVPFGRDAPPHRREAPPSGRAAPPSGREAPPSGRDAPPSGRDAPPPTCETPPTAAVITIDDLLAVPGRFLRPPKLAIVLRGLPGSGKSSVAKLIKVNILSIANI